MFCAAVWGRMCPGWAQRKDGCGDFARMRCIVLCKWRLHFVPCPPKAHKHGTLPGRPCHNTPPSFKEGNGGDPPTTGNHHPSPGPAPSLPDSTTLQSNVSGSWGSLPPPGLGQTDFWAARFSFAFVAPTASNYTFRLIVDDAAALYIDGQLAGSSNGPGPNPFTMWVDCCQFAWCSNILFCCKAQTSPAHVLGVTLRFRRLPTLFNATLPFLPITPSHPTCPSKPPTRIPPPQHVG